MEERIEAVEAAIAGEVTRYRQRQARSNIGPVPFAGTIAESVEDFFSDFERYLNNHEIQVTHASRYIPDFLVGTAQEFYRTLLAPQLRDVTTLRDAFVAQFATQARRQAALQNFYQANQLPTESANQYYCRIKALARAAFHNQDAVVRAQHVTARMRQGIRPEIKRILVGREFATAEELRATIENIEIDVAATNSVTAATKDDLKELIQNFKDTMVANKSKSVPNIHAIDNGVEEIQLAAISRNTTPRRFQQTHFNNDGRQCFYCGCCGHIQRDCLALKRSGPPARYTPNNRCTFNNDYYCRETNQAWRRPNDRSR